MSINTDDKKLALINFSQVYLPPIILNPGADIGDDDKRQLVWWYPGDLAGITSTLGHFLMDTNVKPLLQFDTGLSTLIDFDSNTKTPLEFSAALSAPINMDASINPRLDFDVSVAP